MRIATECVCCGSGDLEKSPAVLMPFVAERVFGWQPVEVLSEWGLKAIPAGKMYCPCNSLHCQVCGASFLDMRFSEEEMLRLYHDYRGEEYLERRLHYEPDYLQRHERELSGWTYMPVVEDFLRPWLQGKPAILDWGGDTGKNAPLAKVRRLLHVYDISEKPLVDGATRVPEPEANRYSYDLIVCNHVLEHVPYPATELRRIEASMHSNTVLYIQIPDDFTDAQADRHYWHEHVTRFTEESVCRLAEQCGLVVVESESLKDEIPGRTLWMRHFILKRKLR